MTGHNTTGGYYQSYVCRLGTLDTLHKKSCRIGPGLSELPENKSYATSEKTIPRTPVNKEKGERWGPKRTTPAKRWLAPS